VIAQSNALADAAEYFCKPPASFLQPGSTPFLLMPRMGRHSHCWAPPLPRTQ